MKAFFLMMLVAVPACHSAAGPARAGDQADGMSAGISDGGGAHDGGSGDGGPVGVDGGSAGLDDGGNCPGCGDLAPIACAVEGAACGGLPPSPGCADANTLRTTSAGVCRSGICSFPETDQHCAAGCAAGACLPCTPSCGGALCGDDGCGGSCGQCPNPDWCGGGGVAGQCGSSSTIGAYPGVTPSQVDNGAARGLRVAPDEAHVMVQRTLVTSGPGSFSEGALSVLTVDSGGVGHARDLTTVVELDNGFPQADFSADSKGLYFVDGSTSPWQLMVANSDGSNLRSIGTGATQYNLVAKNTLVYVLDSPNTDVRAVYAVTLPAGSPVTLAAAGTINYPTIQPNATGSAVVIADESGNSYELATTATGATTPLVGQHLLGVTWSPEGGHLAYLIPGTGANTLRVIGADGTADTLISSTAGSWPVFSPDGQRIAYGESDGQYHLADIRIHPLSGAADVVLTLDNQHYWGSPLFSADGALMLVTCSSSAPGAGNSAMGAAPTNHNGAFAVIATNLTGDGYEPPPPMLTAGHDYAAVDLATRIVLATPTAGGTAHQLPVPVDYPAWYEPVASHPLLAVFTSPTESLYGIPGSVMLFPADGSGSGITLPGAAYADAIASQADHVTSYSWQESNGGALGEGDQPFAWGWLGSELVYEANHGENNLPAFDVIAATDDGVTVGVIASGVSRWSVHDGSSATRLFFARTNQDGVWMTPVPQTPGR